MTRTLIITNTSDIAPTRVLGDKISILADNSQTGSYEVYLYNLTEGAGPPPHSHPWDEAIYITQGSVDINCEGLEATLTAGGFVNIPSDMVHSFRKTSATAQILCICSGKGATKMLTALDRECGDSPKMEKILSVLERNDVSVVMQPARQSTDITHTLDELRLAWGGDTRQQSWSF